MSWTKATRRRFLQGTAASVAAVTLVPARVLGLEGPPPSEKLSFACIGVGGRGGSHVGPAATHNLVALCDVDKNTLGSQAKKYPNAKTFQDYRRLFDAVGKEIDGVFVATPDHHHFFASRIALQLGKHVYCEKPLTHSIWEARQLTELAKKAKVATQMGNQGMSSDATRLTAEFIEAGAIGNVTEAHVWTDRPQKWWPQGCTRPKDTPPVPANIDWDLWLGPAPERPFHPCYLPFKWRGWWDFGTGALGDIGCHAMAPLFFALGFAYPTAVELIEEQGMTDESGPQWSIIRYDFPARGNKPPYKLFWYDGLKKPPKPEELGSRELGEGGELLIGDKGKMLPPRIIPEEKMKEFKRPAPTLPRVPKGDHHEDFFLACKGVRPASSDFSFAGPVAETVLAGNLALRLKRRIELDLPNLKAKNCPEADALIKRPYRKGWDA